MVHTRPQPSVPISYRIIYLVMTAARKNPATWNTDLSARLTDRDSRTQTDYTGPFVYKNNDLAFIQTSEGRIVPDHDTYAYEYFLKDHLGNTRVVFNEQGEVLQSNSYYPFGGIMEGLNYTAGLDPENKYLYNGKELQEDFGLDWYDYGARFYDAQLGRWHVGDPAIENNHYDYTPYAYVYNNPMLFVDPIGLDSLYFFDQSENPNNKRVYTAEIYVEIDGEIVGKYKGSTFPNAPDSENEHNTIAEGENNFDNKSGHSGSTEKGLNIVDEKGSRQNTPGNDSEGNSVTMEWVNVHSGQEKNAAGKHNRGSAGCPTVHPSDWKDFTDHFNWNGKNKNTGDSEGKIFIYRGNTDKAGYTKKSDKGSVQKSVSFSALQYTALEP